MLKNKTILILLGVLSVVALILKIITYNQPAQFFADIPLLFGTGILLLRFRKEISSRIVKIPFPKIVIAVLSAVPLIMLEENVSCPPTGCTLFPETIPILTIFILVLCLVVKFFKIRKFYSTILVFSLLGFANEYFQGYMSTQLHEILFTPGGLIVFIFVVISYAYIAIVPLTVIQE